jgi:glutamate racemase
MTRYGLIHTVPALPATFHDLVADQAARAGTDAEQIHVVDPWLLRAAMAAGGVTPEIVDRLAAHVSHLRDRGVDGVLVTCSTLGEATEQVAERLGGDVPRTDAPDARDVPGSPVVRVDQGMADRAVELAGDGGRVGVLATVASTVGPTERLVRRSAAAAGVAVTVEAELLEEAGRARERGDTDRHDALVDEAVGRWTGRVDVVVLAQASMAGAVSRLVPEGVSAVPVLTSLELAARRLVELTDRS